MTPDTIKNAIIFCTLLGASQDHINALEEKYNELLKQEEKK